MITQKIGVGPTATLSLRVSVATLARIVLPNKILAGNRLALEQKASVKVDHLGKQVKVKAQPFGGAVRLLDPARLQHIIRGFHFDSERSRSEADFRLFINPADWTFVRDFCLDQFSLRGETALETNPDRELVEEICDALGIVLDPIQYQIRPLRTVIEADPTPTDNEYAEGAATVRIYRVFSADITDTALAQAMVDNSRNHPPGVLREMALADFSKGGRGRANAVLVLPEKRIRRALRKIPPEGRGEALAYKGGILDGNVAAVIKGIDIPKWFFLS